MGIYSIRIPKISQKIEYFGYSYWVETHIIPNTQIRMNDINVG
jgi:hypothetical protein